MSNSFAMFKPKELRVEIYNSINKVISTSSWTFTDFNNTYFDIGGCADLANNQIVVPVGGGGAWHFYGGVSWGNAPNGYRVVEIRHSGAFNDRGKFDGPHEDKDFNHFTFMDAYDTKEGDIIQLRVLQTSGGDISIASSANGCFLGGYRLPF